MKHFIFVLLFVLAVSCTKTEPETLPLHNKKVLILGNSITEYGKYVDFIEYYLRKHYPQDSLNIISIGLSSETASGDSEADHPFPRPWIHNRLDKALTYIKPDLVLACYGMNDGIYSNLDSIRFNNYKNGILKLKKKVKAAGSDIILLTPTPFDVTRKNGIDHSETYSYQRPYLHYNNVLNTYANWLTTLEDQQVINFHSFMDEHLKTLKTAHPDSTFIPDGVHPNNIGHFYMAKKVLNDLYPQIVLKDPNTEMNQLKNNTVYDLVCKRRAIRSNGWLRYIGYIKQDTVKLDNIAPTSKHVNELEHKISELLNTK